MTQLFKGQIASYSSGVYVFPATECEESTIKATTTIVVIALPTRASYSCFLLVPTSRLLSVSDRAFPVAAARVWNTLSRGVISASSLPAFKRRLKTELFLRSFPEVAPTASD